MFTGIIKDVGIIEYIKKNQNSLKLGISTKLDLRYLEEGASVSCNGCCLTVVKTQTETRTLFFVDVGPQSLVLTRFLDAKQGDPINIEPALRVGDSLGGHSVSGHIDTL
ncbi:MAG: hypothetical protein K2X39_09865, partial [Silvanigrellaceae bacterium]|nr:hypothetical protein [Silvanigrellaceae bacterium]